MCKTHVVLCLYSDSLGGFTADQLIAFCDVANPGNCTRVSHKEPANSYYRVPGIFTYTHRFLVVVLKWLKE